MPLKAPWLVLCPNAGNTVLPKNALVPGFDEVEEPPQEHQVWPPQEVTRQRSRHQPDDQRGFDQLWEEWSGRSLKEVQTYTFKRVCVCLCVCVCVCVCVWEKSGSPRPQWTRVIWHAIFSASFITPTPLPLHGNIPRDQQSPRRHGSAPRPYSISPPSKSSDLRPRTRALLARSYATEAPFTPAAPLSPHQSAHPQVSVALFLLP